MKACRLCGSKNLALIIDLGEHPLADTFLKEEDLKTPDLLYPLEVLMCKACGYFMSSVVVPKEERYQAHDYSYDSSHSRVSMDHFAEMAGEIAERKNITAQDLVVDIGSNVGTLLAAFREQRGCRVIGVEPSSNVAKIARDNGIPTINDFFNAESVKEILKQGKAKAITATNVFNHIDTLNAFMENILKILAGDGVFVFEVPYMLILVEKTAFDTIYLEHVTYFSVKPFAEYFKKFGLGITSASLNDYMGGSIRVYLEKGEGKEELAQKFIDQENQALLYDEQTYAKFMQRVRKFKQDLLAKLEDLKSRGEKIVGIGAATKGNTLLNYCGIDGKLLEFITDNTPLRVGKYTPGSRILVKRDEDITPDIRYVLILPWNIAPFLIEKLKNLNLKFIVPHLTPNPSPKSEREG